MKTVPVTMPSRVWGRLASVAEHDQTAVGDVIARAVERELRAAKRAFLDPESARAVKRIKLPDPVDHPDPRYQREDMRLRQLLQGMADGRPVRDVAAVTGYTGSQVTALWADFLERSKAAETVRGEK